ncbi:hypothetical protein F2P56_017805 [Juglans regia]|uniref:GDSL esterase/lipase At1g29670-like isoform X1 n=2 Tax=Juglans regia TaxID=51240 RepID=A0A2I4G6E5_JUGRE|nr:GDSL esterase/lipase At1g29670-like isoform X1 [Juglans regia]KAF5461730.1 hypothetical protein F2P56_017805 [Juglans regia]
MAYWLVILGKLQLAALILLVSSFLQQHFANGQPLQVPCFFIFGDSLSDNGNNNNLKTTANSNYQPYGIDFPKGRPTGRFTNGRNLLDFIAEELGFPEDSIPPYAKLATVGPVEKALKGVNYASGAAGILNESGRTRGDRIPMNEQLTNHQKTVSRIINKLGKKNATQLLNKCIYSVAIGTNDYINNYFLPQFYPASRIYTPSQYAEILLRKLSQQLRTLHRRKARKVVVYGLGLLGCIPYEVKMYGANISGCVDKINEAVMLFNNGLKSLVSDLNNNHTINATFIFINSTGISLTSSPGSITVSNAACCQVSEASAPQCIRSGKTCSNRTQYAFWDEAHPTEAAYSATAARAYRALLPTDSYPFDIQRLAQL